MAQAERVPLGFGDGPWQEIAVDGYVPGPSEDVQIRMNVIAPGFLDLLRFDAMPFEEYTTASLFGQKMAASLLAVLGAVALVLAAVGLYSVMAYAVTQRTQELGVRMALGARPLDVLGMVVRQGLGLALGGLALGMLGAIGAMRGLSSLLVGVSAADPLTFAAVAGFLTLVALLASYLPARRAATVDPMEALRHQ